MRSQRAHGFGWSTWRSETDCEQAPSWQISTPDSKWSLQTSSRIIERRTQMQRHRSFGQSWPSRVERGLMPRYRAAVNSAVFARSPRALAGTRTHLKTTGTCPKCGSREVIRIPGSVSGHGAGNNIPVGVTIFSSVRVTRFLCSRCGYSEEWIESPADIEKLRNRYGGSGSAG